MRFKNRGKAIAAVSALILLALPLSACGLRPQTDIIAAGSTSVQPYAEILAEEYAHLYDEGEIDIQGGGSSAGITAAESGTADIGMSSRTLKEEEQGLWQIEIAKDGLAIIVHPDNPVTDLTLEQICGIYTREIDNWRELGGNDAPIHIITREEGSGTRSAFEDLVMSEERDISPKAIVQDSNGQVRLLVSNDKNAIGFISLGLVEQQPGLKPVTALALEGVQASRENVVNGSYSLFRPFLFVCKQQPEGKTKQFVDFVLSPDGQQILINEGLIPVAEGTVK